MSHGSMVSPPEILRLNPELDIAALRKEFDRVGRVQVKDVLDQDAAERLTSLLIQQTPWGLSWQAGSNGPHRIARDKLQTLSAQHLQDIQSQLTVAMQNGQFAFIYSQYQASAAAEQGWSTSLEHDKLASEISHPEILRFIREITGSTEISRSDAQATHFGPGHFLTVHEDTHASEHGSRVIAYVLNLCPVPWRVDWGGYLNFFDSNGDIVQGYRPRFNALNLFKVPALHSVSTVTADAPQGRLAVTGWFYSR